MVLQHAAAMLHTNNEPTPKQARIQQQAIFATRGACNTLAAQHKCLSDVWPRQKANMTGLHRPNSLFLVPSAQSLKHQECAADRGPWFCAGNSISTRISTVERRVQQTFLSSCVSMQSANVS